MRAMAPVDERNMKESVGDYSASFPTSACRPPPVYDDYRSGDDSGKGVSPCFYCCSPTTSSATFFCTEKSSNSSTTFSSMHSLQSSSSDGSKSKIFPSTRFFIAVLLCFCFISLSISTSNLSVSMVCMIRKHESVVATINREFADADRVKRESDFKESLLTTRDLLDSRISNNNLVINPEQQTLNAEILRLKRSLPANIMQPDESNRTLQQSDANSEVPSNATSSSNFLLQIFHTLEALGVDNVTLQYKALRDDSNRISDASNDLPTRLEMPVKLCQLARFRRGFVSLESSKDDYNNKMMEKSEEEQDEKSFLEKQRKGYVTVTIESCYEAGKLDWSSTDQGIVFAAQNAGSLLMLFTGTQADRLNSKWTIVAALLLLVASNIMLPVFAHESVWLVVAARVLTGFSDALLQPSTNSLITRWFPPKERSFAVGLITGGRQIGTLLILPVAGILCSRHDIFQGWPAIFYLSALIGSVILITWLFMAADKPSKHFYTSHAERCFIEAKISEENLGKRTQRRNVPWRQIATCRPIYIGIAALICHEYPLVIMLQLLPKYINDVLKFSITTNGIVSALPIAVLFLSKTLSASLSSVIGSRKKGRFVVGRTTLVKIFNAIASLGLGVCIAIVPLLTSENQKVMAIFVLCMANAFAGLHTPGVQTALLQLAPAYTGVITGIAFGFVAIFSIINKVLSNYIVQSGSVGEWKIVFWISAVVAVLPVVFFSIWGSAKRQHWATNRVSADSIPSVSNKLDFMKTIPHLKQ